MDFLKGLVGTAFNPLLGGASMASGDEGMFRQFDPIMGKMLGFQSDEEKAVQEAIKKAAAQQQAYRPYAAQARMQSLDNIRSLYGPVSQALQSMYGSQYGLNTEGLMNSPVSPEMLQATGAKMPAGQGQPAAQPNSIYANLFSKTGGGGPWPGAR